MKKGSKKLNFMGNEIAMFREWDETREPDWDLLKMPAHDAFLHFMTALNDCYGKKPALWALDGTYDGFKWVESVSDNPCVFGYTKTDGEAVDLILLNFSDQEATLVFDDENEYTMLLNTGWEEYGGQEKKVVSDYMSSVLAPFSGILLRRMDRD